MPLYDYTCLICNKKYEVQVPLSKYGEPVKCPYCGKDLHRLIKPVYFKVN